MSEEVTPIEHVNDDGSTVQVVPLEVYNQTTEKIKTIETELADNKILLQEKNTNFTKYNELTEEQKKSFTENERSLLMRNDQLEADLKSLKEGFDKEKETNQTSTKTTIHRRFHADDATTKAKFDENYAKLAGMPEGTPDEITARSQEAARLSGISIDSVNPLYVGIDGEPPRHKDNKEFTETPTGKEALDLVRQRMNVKAPQA